MSKLIFLFIGLLAMAGRVEAKSASEDQRVREMVDSLTRQAMSGIAGCHRGIVYVVETKTGRLVAHTSLEGSDNLFSLGNNPPCYSRTQSR